ncbi:MAG: AAA family ATPase [Planctomycetota bacterium]
MAGLANTFRDRCDALVNELKKVIVGHDDAVRMMCAAFFSGGHVLIEGVPGLGKTLLAASFARATSLEFKKIQFTPDLMPADITGTHVIVEKDGGRVLEFRKGPLFANFVLADEINRATPKTQSALLEGMQERCVTAGRETMPLPEPFMVLATQNPVEMKGTYPLPEAQQDRFAFKVIVAPADAAGMAEILRRTTGVEVPAVKPVLDRAAVLDMARLLREVVVSPHIRELAARVVMLTCPTFPDAPEPVRRFVRLGASIRGGQALIAAAQFAALMDGQVNATAVGVTAHILPALRHRLILSFEAGADGVTPDAVLAAVAKALQ